jgi:hypothetical protein
VTSTDSTGSSDICPQIVYYEPRHNEATTEAIGAVFASRGYAMVTEDTAFADAWVFIPMNRVDLCVDLGNRCADLAPVDQWASPVAYVTGILDWIEGASPAAGIEPSRGHVIYCESQHDEATTRLLRATLADRGYALADAALDVFDESTGPDLHITVNDSDGVQTILFGDVGCTLDPVEAYLTVEEYGLAIADWFDSDHTAAPPAPLTAPAAEAIDPERAAWIAGVRAFCDLIESNPAIPLPHNDVLTFNVSEHHADRIAAHMKDVEETYRPGEPYDHLITGTLAGAQIALRFGCARRGVQI